jgi:hypothetical protein
VAGRAGTPAARGGSHRGCRSGGVGARLVQCTGRRAMVGAGEVEGGPLWLVVGRYLELAAAARSGRRRTARSRQGGSARRGQGGSGRLNRRRATLY